MPAARRSSDLTILVVAGVATVLLSVLSFILAPVQSSRPIDGSSFATHPQGARAAYLGLKQAGYRVDRSFEPLAELRREPSDVVLVLASPGQAPSQQDTRALTQFLARGGVLLAAGASSVPFLPGNPFRPGAFTSQASSIATASMVSPISLGVEELHMAPPLSALSAQSPYVPVYGDEAKPFVIAAAFGKGRAIWFSGTTPLTNAGIARTGHAEVLANVLGAPPGRLVLWDEHYHGHSRSLWSYVAGTPVPYAGVQLALVFVASLFAFSRRRWPLRAEPVEPRTSPLEFVDSMGALYERAGGAMGAVETVRARVRRALVTASGLPPAASDDELSRAAAARVSMDIAELQNLLASSEKARHDFDLRPDDARSIVAALQSVAARLQ